jgi:hypothetical protein
MWVRDSFSVVFRGMVVRQQPGSRQGFEADRKRKREREDGSCVQLESTDGCPPLFTLEYTST